MSGLYLATGGTLLMSLAGAALYLRRLRLCKEKAKGELRRDHVEHQILAEIQVPKSARRHLDKVTPQLASMDFTIIGTYCTRADPPVFERYFISADNRTFASVQDWEYALFRRKYTYVFMTVMADNTYVESRAAEIPPPAAAAEESGPFWLQGSEDASVRDLYRSHLDTIDQLCDSGDNPAQKFLPKEIKEVVDYGHQLAVWNRRCHRGIQSDPPELVREEEQVQAGVFFDV